MTRSAKALPHHALMIFLMALLCASCSRFEIIDIPKDQLGPKGHIELAVSYEKSLEYGLALREYEKAIDLDPKDPDAHFGAGNICLIKKDWPVALTHLKKAIKLDPTKAPYHNNLAIAYMGLERFDEAIASARKGLELDQTRAYIYLDTLGMIHENANETGLAENAYKDALARATEARADEVEILKHLQGLYVKTGNLANAELMKDALRAHEMKK